VVRAARAAQIANQTVAEADALLSASSRFAARGAAKSATKAAAAAVAAAQQLQQLQLNTIEFTQLPGDTVFVPGGWWHSVVNLQHSVAITQNFCSRQNFDKVWQETRGGRPKMAVSWLQRMGMAEAENENEVEGQAEQEKQKVGEKVCASTQQVEAAACSAGERKVLPGAGRGALRRLPVGYAPSRRYSAPCLLHRWLAARALLLNKKFPFRMRYAFKGSPAQGRIATGDKKRSSEDVLLPTQLTGPASMRWASCSAGNAEKKLCSSGSGQSDDSGSSGSRGGGGGGKRKMAVCASVPTTKPKALLDGADSNQNGKEKKKRVRDERDGRRTGQHTPPMMQQQQQQQQSLPPPQPQQQQMPQPPHQNSRLELEVASISMTDRIV
jgi:hypothetical protein